MKKILVTGGAGFIGSHLVDRLVELGHQVVVWDNMSTGKKENFNPSARYYDISVEDITPKHHHKSGYEAIFHLAAEPRIQPSFQRPLEVHESNVTGTANMLEVARLTGASLVFAGSSSVYHDPYANPYSFSKQIAEYYCKLYKTIYSVPAYVARFFNVYGPRQIESGPYSTVIGVFERQKREGVPLTITGDGDQRRDFTHVNDIVSGLIKIEENQPGDFDLFNLGSGTNYSINEVAAMFSHPSEYIPARPGEARETLAFIELSERYLDWKPTMSLKAYIESLDTAWSAST